MIRVRLRLRVGRIADRIVWIVHQDSVVATAAIWDNRAMTRRQTLRALAGGIAAAAAPGRSAPQPAAAYKDYFGDLHNHNNVGYAQGSLKRTFEIARDHLDFFAFTPHAWWHDIGKYDLGIEDKWINGFAVTTARWQEVLEFNRKYDAPGKFVPIAGYEWHSRTN